jgi:hypothetical protein
MQRTASNRPLIGNVSYLKQTEGGAQLKITIEILVKAELTTVWGAWNNPEDIQQWNAA